jgi:cytochrome c553
VRRGLSLGAAALAALLGAPAAAQDAARGAALAEERGCGACHGARGVSAIPNIPSLAGQQAEFSTLQLILFREGLRQVPAMTEAARGLSDTQVEDLAAHFAALPSVQPADRGARDPALVLRGAEVAAGRNCNACHLPSYAGQQNVPRISHQREDFLAHTLTEYRDGQRVGADTQMNGLMHGVTDADIRALAHYLAQRE